MTLEQRIILLAQAIGADVKSVRGTIGVLANLTTTSKADIVTALNEVLAKATTNSASIGTMTSLTTTAKGSLVAALNEVKASISSVDMTQLINDAALAGVTNKTFSADRILSLVASSVSALVDSSPAALDTLKELAASLGNDANFATTISTALGKRVRVDAVQTFTALEQDQARSNINAASVASVTAITTALGNTDSDLAATYSAAKV